MEFWRNADTPPLGGLDAWSCRVVAVTNYENVFMLRYYRGKDGGYWQRPAAFEDGESVTVWTLIPST